MKHIIRLFILIAALALGTDHAWADITANPRVKFVYVEGNNYSSESEKGFAFASSGETTGPLTIAVDIYNGQDYRCIEGDLTAEQSINSINAEVRRRAPGKGVPVPLHYSKTNEFTLTLPEDESTNVTVYVKFSSKLEFTPEVSIEGWTYGEAAKTPTITGNTSGGAVTYTYADAVDGTYTETVPTLAGPHWVKATVATTADYKECESEPFEFTITKKDLTVTAKDHWILYGNAAANNGVSYDGFVNNETESVLEGELTYTYSYDANNDKHKPGTYQITPSGLTSNNYDITFVSGDLEVIPVHVPVRVVDKADGEKIETAFVTVQVLDNGKVVTECQFGWDSVINDLKTGVTYTLRETKAPEGYVLPTDITFTIDETGKITSTGSTTTNDFGNTVLLLENSKTHVEVSVVNIADGKEIAGAHVQVLYGDGNVVEDLEGNDVVWTSGTENYVIEGLNTNVEYTLRETVAPDGYTIPTANTFTIDETGKITSSGTVSENGVLLVENSKTKVKVSVVDIADGATLECATIQVIDSEGNVVEEWVSTDENHEIEGLKTGVAYTLRETVAPEGYTIPADITFTISNDGKVTTTGSSTTDNEGYTVLLVENAKTHVEVSVVDIADGEEIAGAHVQIIDSNGDVVEEWTSGTANHIIEELKTGEEYTMKETVAPEGYVIPTDIKFTIDETGKVTTTGTITNEGVLLVENTKTHVEVSVVNKATKEALEGATVRVLDGDNKVVEEWVSGTENHAIEGLKTGEEYTLRETVAPSGYAAPADYKFTIAPDGSITFTGNQTNEGVLLVENAPKVTVTITGNTDTKDYNGEEQSVTGYDVVISNTLYTKEDFTFNGTATASGTNAGTYPMQLKREDFVNTNDNFDVTFNITDGALTIQPKSITVKADDKKKEWDGVSSTDPELTATVDGLIGEDAITYSLSRESGEDTGKYTITPTGEANQGNYTLTFETGTFTIVAATVTDPNIENQDDLVTPIIALTKDQNGTTATLAGQSGQSDGAFIIKANVAIDHVKLDRQFVSAKKAAICWPFDVTSAQASELGKFYAFTGTSEGAITMQEVTGGLVANTPYIFEPSSDINTLIDFGGKTLTAGGPISVTLSGITFKGIYNRVKWTTDTSDKFYNADRASELGKAYGFALQNLTVGSKSYYAGQFVRLGSGAESCALRAYMLVDDWDGNQPSTSTKHAAAKSLPDVIEIKWISADGSVTEIEKLPTAIAEDKNGWYDLQGRKLNSKPSTSGLYINNGKKIIVK